MKKNTMNSLPFTLMLFSLIILLFSAPAMGAEDSYEDDDAWEKANVLPLWDGHSTTPDNPDYDFRQVRNFHDEGDDDWVVFYAAVRDVAYLIEVGSPGADCNAVIEVYSEHDLVNPVKVFNYPFYGEPDPLYFRPPHDGVFYARIRNWDPTKYGRGAEYELKLSIPRLSFNGGFIQGSVHSADRAVITTSGKDGTIAFSNGHYFMPHVPGNFILSIEIPGFTTYSAPITVRENESTTFNFDLSESYVITADAGAGGTISPSGAVKASRGSDQTFMITPNQGYDIDDVLVDGSSIGAVESYTFRQVAADHTFEARFTPSAHTISASPGEHGAISPAGAVAVSYGSDQAFTITPDQGYDIDDVLVDGSPIGAVESYTFRQVAADHTIEARFTLSAHTISASSWEHGAISPAGAVEVSNGTDQAFTIIPDGGYGIANVKVDGSTVGAISSYTFSNVAESHTIEAFFAPIMCTIAADSGLHGSISPSGPVTAAYGAGLAFTITPDSGYAVENVTVDGLSMGAASVFTFRAIIRNHTIKAQFKPVEYTIAAGASPGGSLSPSGEARVATGARMTFFATPDPGCIVDDIRVDGESVGAASGHTFANIAGDHSIEATFDCVGPFYEITAAAGPGGGISPSGRIWLKEGSDKIFKVNPGPGYVVDEATVDGIPVEFDSDYIFENVASDHALRVTFTPDGQNPPGILPDIKANGSDDPIYLSSAESVSININLAPGQKEGLNADWWIAAHMLDSDPACFFYTPPGLWRPEMARAAELPLVWLDNIGVSFLSLPPGDFIFYFGVDDNADENLDATWWDSVEVHVRE